MPGPIPNASGDLSRRRNANRANRPDLVIGERKPVSIPDADPNWHPIATRIYESARTSGQSDFYQDSDWAILWSICEDISMYKKPSVNRDGEEYYKRSGQMLQTIMSSLTSLMLTEGERRRARLELAEPKPEEDSASVTAINSYKQRMQSK